MNNLKHLNNGKFFLSFLSSFEKEEKELVHIQRGYSNDPAEQVVKVTTLDSLLLATKVSEIDVLKIDVEGFDGKVLSGSKKILENFKPAVIFEWNPVLCKQTGNNWTEHFEILLELGYCNFIWFDKLGKFSHFTINYDKKVLDLLAELCLRNKAYSDLHYDIIALHHTSQIDPLALAELLFAKARRSKF